MTYFILQISKKIIFFLKSCIQIPKILLSYCSILHIIMIILAIVSTLHIHNILVLPFALRNPQFLFGPRRPRRRSLFVIF